MKWFLASLLAASLAVPVAAAAAEDVASLYKARCATCHGATGEPTSVGKKMGAKPITAGKLTAEQATEIITKGEGKMPAYKSKLTSEQISQLGEYVAGGMKAK